MQKIQTWEQIEQTAKTLKAQGKTLVTTSGSFDILHGAHINFLEKAKQQGDHLIILLNSDSSIKRFKGETRPIVPQDERAIMLSALKCVDFITIFEQDKPLNLIEKIKPQIHVKGGSWIEERIKEEKELLESWGGEFRTFELEEGFSTTNIIEEILKKHR